jgi:hypothetical protein
VVFFVDGQIVESLSGGSRQIEGRHSLKGLAEGIRRGEDAKQKKYTNSSPYKKHSGWHDFLPM